MTAATVKSTERGFAILEMFDRERRPLSLRDICAELGYAPSSGLSILKSLVTLGYLDFDSKTHTYLPTMRISYLGRWVEDVLFGDGQLIRMMERLHSSTGRIIILGTQSGLYAQWVHVVAGQSSLNFIAPPGTLRPLTSSGVGLMLLSGYTDVEIEKICRQINYFNSEERVEYETVLKTIEDVRRNGYALTIDTPLPGGSLLSVAVPGVWNHRRLAIGMPLATSSVHEQLEPALGMLRMEIASLGAQAAP
ncbi:IclR family transcriptional regulator [Phenylobacterium sp.]|uniref:IclR family transcriptional regulator n=1 Tax=Phenylobacterium sp. TaxID=1871053 RepID=UPI00273368D5|nr:helix-turn-helix domain-containing protein [Phenylobacterium sp.]MDP3659424.1 helix-turn-helix domain-containing protein [Phenylobacterium sp.]